MRLCVCVLQVLRTSDEIVCVCVTGNENRVPIGILEVQVELFPKLSVLLQVLRTSDEIVCVTGNEYR